MVHLLLTFLVLLVASICSAEDVIVTVGQDATLPCTSVANYPVWVGSEKGKQLTYNNPGNSDFANPNIPVQKKPRLGWGSDNKSLMIRNVVLTDRGRYQCNGDINLIVRVPPLSPVILNTEMLPNNDVIIRATQSIQTKLVCVSSGGYPEPKVEWYKGNTGTEPLSSTTNVTNGSNSFTVTETYTFSPEREDDGDRYICQSSFDTEPKHTLATNVKLVLNLKPNPPTVEQTSTVSAGNSVEVRCRTTGSRPAAVISWSYNNSRLTGSREETYVNATQTYTVVSVVRRQVTAVDNGQSLKCIVTNEVLDQPLTAAVKLNIYFSVNAQTTKVTGNKLTNATGNTAITLNCTTGSSNPASDITWLNNSVPISSNDKYTTWRGENNGQVRSQNLALKPTRYMDGDVIICSVSNVVNTQSPITDTATLDLQYSPIVSIEGQEQYTLSEGETKLISCKVESKPKSTIKWYHHDTEIAEGTSVNNILNHNLAPVNRIHYGVYKCEASNGIGPKDEEQISITVKFKPITTELTGSINIIANGNNPLTLTCTSGSSNPISDLTWKINNIMTHNTVSLSNLTGEYGGIKRRSTLALRPERENDGDVVSCQATNEKGTSTKNTTKLNLKYHPLIKQMSEVIVVEGNSTELTCIASSKPASTFKWYREGQSSNILKQGAGTLDNNKLSYTINAVKRTDASTYTCNADNGIEMADNQNVRLTVQYPPDVTPRATNTTVNNASTLITCNASGIPNINYKFGKWIQTWPGYSTPVSERYGSRILELTKLTYEHSGIYTCSASNGIKVFGTNQEFKEGSVQLLVKSFPIITAWDDKSPARLKENATVKVDFYSNIDGSIVKCFKMVNGSEETQVRCSVFEAAVEVDLPVFTQTIKTAGRRAMVMIEIQTEKDFGTYKVVVKNEINSTSRSVQIVPKGPPSIPFNMTIDEVQSYTALISWIRGFHGGFEQTFIIQFSTDLTVWRNKSLDGGLSESKEPVSTVLSGLKDSTTYYVRMFAVNQEGKSQYTDILNYTTSSIEGKEPSKSALIGGAAGGSAAIIVILAVVIVVTLRRRGFFAKDKSSPHADKSDRKPVCEDDDDYGMQDNPMYESSGPRNQGQSAGSSRSCEDGAVYSTVDKKKPVIGNSNDVYAEVDKSKKTGQKPGKKEKSKQDKKGKNAAKEGELYANAAATEMKIKKTKQNVNNETIYENPEPSKQNAKKNVNKDGLIYADLTFNDQPKGQKKLVIHGLDSMTEYVEVDFTKKADPLPDSDDENDPQRKKTLLMK